MNVERDVLDRLDRAGIDYYVTGSWALSVYAEPRMTRDLDLVVELGPGDYESRIRQLFEDTYLVNDVIHSGARSIGGLIPRTEIVRVDLMISRFDGWSRAAYGRRRIVDHPGLGRAWVISVEDLLLAKLDWSDGGSSELQLRDCRSIVRLAEDIDWTYLERYAAELGVSALLEDVRGG